MRHEQKISLDQKRVIVEFMEHNIRFANGTALRKKNEPTQRELWNQLTSILNKTPGPKKDRIKWQKAWSDIKQALEIKFRKVQFYRNLSSEHCILYKSPKLSEIDERIIAIMKSKFRNEDKQRKYDNTDKTSAKNELNFKIKEENDLHTVTSDQSMNLCPNTSMFGEEIVSSDGETYSDTICEETSNLSWNSHDNRSTAENKNLFNSKHLEQKLDSVSVQLEQLIEQNRVSNILLERIATTLENKNN